MLEPFFSSIWIICLFVCFWYAVYFFDIHIHLFINFREIVLYHICEYMDFLFSISSLHYLFFASFMGLYYDDLKSFIYVSDSIFSHVYSVHCCFCFRINFAMELFWSLALLFYLLIFEFSLIFLLSSPNTLIVSDF